jgi:hypothetical protein
MPLKSIRRLAGFMLVLIVTAACSLANSPSGEEVALVFEGAPMIRIASPLSGSVYREGTSINILARVENAGADIRRVDIFVGDERVAESDNPNESNAAAFTITTSWLATRTGNQTIQVQVTRTDGVTSAIEQVQVEVRGRVVPTATFTPTSDATATSVIPPTEAAPAQPTTQPTTADQGAAPQQPVVEQPVVEQPAATATSSAPRVRVKQGANVRSGPSTAFDPPIGALPTGAEADILAQAPGGAWLKITFYNNSGWISTSTVDVVGDLASVAVEAGPPTPQPVVQQPAPNPQQPAAPAQPAGGADLVVDGTPNINPHPFICGESSEVYVVVKNVGSARAEASRLFLRDVKDGQTQSQTEANVGALEPGASTTVGPMYLSVSAFVGEAHVTVVIVDAGSSIAEANETNNTFTSQPYTLGSGSQC